MDFDQALTMFRDDRIRELSEQADGLRYLKLRSLNRREHLDVLFQAAGVEPAESTARAMFREAYDNPACDTLVIESVIRSIYGQERAGRKERETDCLEPLGIGILRRPGLV